jgi:hypothetical protein
MKENEGISSRISQTSEDLAFLSFNFNCFLSLNRGGIGKAGFDK